VVDQALPVLKMKHAVIHIGEYNIPLIGIPDDAVREVCDVCKTKHHIQSVELMGRYILCRFCKDKLRWHVWTGLLSPPIFRAVLSPDKGLHTVAESRWYKTEDEAKEFIKQMKLFLLHTATARS
jgi:hypothetical protein